MQRKQTNKQKINMPKGLIPNFLNLSIKAAFNICCVNPDEYISIFYVMVV